MLYLDTETCGLHGPVVLLQYAIDDGPIHLCEVWRQPVKETLELIEMITTHTVIMFNSAFDWFHLCQLYTTLRLLPGDKPPNILAYAEAEPEARDGPCLKPAHTFDLMLHARKGEFQSTMKRKDIRIKRVPRVLAQPLITELTKRVNISGIYFANAQDKTIRWQIDEIDEVDLVDIVLRFKPSSALKTLAVYALGVDATIAYQDIQPHPSPLEFGWAPFALAVSNPENNWGIKAEKTWRYAWPQVIQNHIDHWAFNQTARQYAEDDVKYTRDLYKYFGCPEVDDTDSILACMVGAVRWRGYAINHDKIINLRQIAIKKAASVPIAPNQAKAYIVECLTEVEREILTSTKKEVLEGLAEDLKDHPAGKRAQEVVDARKAKKEIEIYDKLLTAGRFHASFKVIGTFSTRMAGTDGLNPQGIKHAKEVREAFPMAFKDYSFFGGDFDAFEVSIADAVYGDLKLREQLCTCSRCGNVCDIEEYGNSDNCSICGGERRKIHGLFGMELSGLSYDEVVASKGTADDWYDKGKRGIFAQFYGGNYNTLMTRLRISEEVARKAEQGFLRRYKGIGEARRRIAESFSPLRQPGGIGSRVEWHEPDQYIESIFGHKRFFTLELSICKALFTLAAKLPPQWRQLEGRIVRRDRDQKIGGAVMSALYAAAFSIQGVIFRAAANHVIQSPGATITKELQCELWDLQPVGVSDFTVIPMNVHDEILCPTNVGNTKTVVDNFVKRYREHIPLLKIKWGPLNTWADK